ncbi:hypothetical protein P154DRAFT_569681 [Amniculicola lignicola CBS 123094]|uniref:Uncharacterized protein n=1 Tax=Amniculicola lignicola CBS 123094 TaxID=1392246 RepID=A0A6A5X1L3_9PLEO|nr:hypothetical protein P154DRAFT_569681 [Amniculicola lignicola CBS 123094]
MRWPAPSDRGRPAPLQPALGSKAPPSTTREPAAPVAVASARRLSHAHSRPRSRAPGHSQRPRASARLTPPRPITVRAGTGPRDERLSRSPAIEKSLHRRAARPPARGGCIDTPPRRQQPPLHPP